MLLSIVIKRTTPRNETALYDVLFKGTLAADGSPFAEELVAVDEVDLLDDIEDKLTAKVEAWGVEVEPA